MGNSDLQPWTRIGAVNRMQFLRAPALPGSLWEVFLHPQQRLLQPVEVETAAEVGVLDEQQSDKNRRPFPAHFPFLTALIRPSAATVFPAAASANPHNISRRARGTGEICQSPNCAPVTAGMPKKMIASRIKLTHWIRNLCMNKPGGRLSSGLPVCPVN